MKSSCYFLIAALTAFSPAHATTAPGDYIMYIGSYTDAPSTSKGIFAWRFSPAKGSFTPLGMVAQTINPAYVETTKDGRFLYTVNWQTPNSKTGDTVTAYAVNRKTGTLTFLDQVDSGGGLPNEIVLDRTNHFAVVTNYGARGTDLDHNNSSVAAMRVETDGKLGEPFYVDHHPGAGMRTSADGPGAHTHGVIFSRDDHWAYVAELGLDRVYAYRFDAAKASMSPGDPPFVTLDPGSGPRREALSPDGKFLYVICQNDSKISTLSVDGGNLKEIQKISTIPADYKGRNSTAEIRMDRTGHFLYGSNRGNNSMALYRVDPKTGMLTTLEVIPSLGKSPRNIAIDPTGHYFFASNQNSDDVVVFRIDAKTGHLTPTGQDLKMGQPASISFVKAD